MKKTGNTYCFQDPPRVLAYASVVAKRRGEGPLGKQFDYIYETDDMIELTFDQIKSGLWF